MRGFSSVASKQRIREAEVENFLAACADPYPAVDDMVQADPDLYDLARNVGPIVLSAVQLYRRSGNEQLLEYPRTWYNDAKVWLSDRYESGFLEWDHGTNETMDGLMSHAALASWTKALPPGDSDRTYWEGYMEDEYMAHWGGGFPNHNLAHPTLARAILEHHYGSTSTRDSKVTQFLGGTTTVDIGGGLIARPWNHHTTLPTLNAQRVNYARYPLQYVLELYDLGAPGITWDILTEMGRAFTHYAIEVVSPLALAPYIIGDDNPTTGLTTGTNTDDYDESNYRAYPGYAQIEVFEDGTDVATINSNVAGTYSDAPAPFFGMALADLID